MSKATLHTQAPHTQAPHIEAGDIQPTAPTQLRLLPGGTPRPDWVLDDRTRKLGRQGVAQVRETLRRSRPPSESERRAS